MKITKSRKGQGGDTFKLLIAAVVAMVILGIVTGVFQNIWDTLFKVTCVSSPINELVTKIQKAQAGITTSTGAICLNAGEMFGADALKSKVTNLAELRFECQGAAVCKNNDPIEVSEQSLDAKAEAKFKGLITCSSSSDGQGDYDCTIVIQSAG